MYIGNVVGLLDFHMFLLDISLLHSEHSNNNTKTEELKLNKFGAR